MPDFAIYPSLAGKSVVVTGGGSGIGAEIVRAFAAQGAKVGFLDLDAKASQALCDELLADGAEVAFEHCDLRTSPRRRSPSASSPAATARPRSS